MYYLGICGFRVMGIDQIIRNVSSYSGSDGTQSLHMLSEHATTEICLYLKEFEFWS